MAYGRGLPGSVSDLLHVREAVDPLARAASGPTSLILDSKQLSPIICYRRKLYKSFPLGDSRPQAALRLRGY